MKMNVMIVGGGKTGSYLAQLLLDADCDVKIVEIRPAVISRLVEELPSDTVITGDGSSPNLLEANGVREVDVLAAITGEDETNLVVTTLAKYEFCVPRVIARVNNPKNAWLFTSEMGVDVALNQADIMATMIEEEMSMGDMMTLLKLKRGKYSLVEETIQAGAPGLGVEIKDLGLSNECVIAAIIRQGTVVIPRGTSHFEEGDEVLFITNAEGSARLKELFSPSEPSESV